MMHSNLEHSGLRCGKRCEDVKMKICYGMVDPSSGESLAEEWNRKSKIIIKALKVMMGDDPGDYFFPIYDTAINSKTLTV